MDGVLDELLDGAEVAAEAAEPIVLPFGEWLNRALDVFANTLAFVMDTPLLRFFAVFGVMWVIFSLCSYLVRSGKSLSH